MSEDKDNYEKQINNLNRDLIEGFIDIIGELQEYAVDDYELGRLLGKLFYTLNHYEVLIDG
ncbi:MAG: hypothetical protein ACLFPS_05885 [Clostridia bacterium]